MEQYEDQIFRLELLKASGYSKLSWGAEKKKLIVSNEHDSDRNSWVFETLVKTFTDEGTEEMEPPEPRSQWAAKE